MTSNYSGTDAFVKLMRRGRNKTVPFWEVWFGMSDFCDGRYGPYENIESRIKMAIDLGMDAVYLSWIDTNSLFMNKSDDSGGAAHYDGGQLHSLDQLAERDLPEFIGFLEKLKDDRRKVMDAGLVCWMVLVNCFHAGSISMGLEYLSLKIYDDPDFVHTFFKWVEARNRKAIELLVMEVMPDFVLIDGDCAFKTGLMVHPEIYREFVFEETKRTLAELKKLKIPYAFHSDGKADDILPLLIELEFSAFHGCEKVANKLDHLVGQFGGEICLVGNMDIDFLTNSLPDQIRSETEEMLIMGSKKGKFIASCNTSPLDCIPEANYLAFCDVIRNF